MPGHVMVLVYMPELRHSVWQDYITRTRTVTALIKQLRLGVRNGRFIAYRLMTIHGEWSGTPTLSRVKPKNPTK